MRFLIVDDHIIVRQGLKQILAEAFPRAEFGECGRACEAIDLVNRETWDVVIMDISLPGRSGLDALKEIRGFRPGLPVLVVSMHTPEQFGVRVIRAGAAGYLSKDAAPEMLVEAMRKVLAGKKYISPALAEKLAATLSGAGEVPHDSLSDREFEVLRRIAAGKTVGDIAEELALSVSTVSTYRARILEKLQLETNADLIRYAVDRKLVY